MVERRVIETSEPKRRYGVVAAIFVALAIASTVLTHVEYAIMARARFLALGLAMTLFGVAMTAYFGLRFAHRFEIVQAPREIPETAPAEDFGAAVSPRRGILALAGGAAMSLLAIARIPLRSLGHGPRQTLHATAWRRGVRLVTALGGAPLRPEDLSPGSATPVVPAGSSDDTNSIAVLVRLRRSRELRAYSRICTHSGCAVSVFRSQESELVCPCHHSVFDAAAGGGIVSGPASQPLPELPLSVDADGFLVADGEFNRPIGPRLG